MHKPLIFLTFLFVFLFYNHIYIYIASSLQITTCVTVRLPVAFAALTCGAGGRRGSDMDQLETCRAAEGRELLLAGQGGRGLASEAGGWVAGWMEKEEDYIFFSPPRCSAVASLLGPLHPPACSFLVSLVEAAVTAHTRTQAEERTVTTEAVVYFSCQKAGVYSHSTGTALCRVSSESKNDRRDLTGYENKERATTMRQSRLKCG